MKIRTVKWYDAIQRRIDSDVLKELLKVSTFISGKDLLAINTTHGKVEELKDVVIIVTEESSDMDTEITVIPKEWVISIK